MTGQELYGHYVECNEYHDCGVDPWESLDEKDQTIWNDIAYAVEMRFGPPEMRFGPPESKSGQSL